MNERQKWDTVASQYIVSDRWLKLRADTCLTPDGHTIDPYYVSEHPDWVNCLVVDGDQYAIMIRQYRHGVNEYILEVIGGGVDPRDISPVHAMRRELKEELGYVGGEIYQTGISYANPANQTNKIYSFLAVGGECASIQSLEPGETMHIERIAFVDIIKRMNNSGFGEIFQSYNLTNLLFALNFIRASDASSLQQLKSLF